MVFSSDYRQRLLLPYSHMEIQPVIVTSPSRSLAVISRIRLLKSFHYNLSPYLLNSDTQFTLRAYYSLFA